MLSKIIEDEIKELKSYTSYNTSTTTTLYIKGDQINKLEELLPQAKKQDNLMKGMLRFIELNKEQYWLNDRGWKDYDKIIQKAKQWEGK